MPDWVSEKLVIQKHQYAETKRKKNKENVILSIQRTKKRGSLTRQKTFRQWQPYSRSKIVENIPTPSSKGKVKIYSFFLEGFTGISHPLIPSCWERTNPGISWLLKLIPKWCQCRLCGKPRLLTRPYSTSPSQRKSVLNVHWKDWRWHWNSKIWPPDAKNWLTGKEPDAGKDWRRVEKGITDDGMVGWHPHFNQLESE